jgi:antitoxin (DNA-binding transcriptional repressor) of toxin-antitoxin stability system
MKLVGLRAAKAGLSALVAHAQKERVIVTRHGRPAVLMLGVEGQDLETIMLAADARFWSWLEARRRETPVITLAEAEERYLPDRSRAPKAAVAGTSRPRPAVAPARARGRRRSPGQ